MKNTLRRGIVALATVMITTLMLTMGAMGASAATPEQQNTANYVSSMRNAAGLPSLNISEQMNSAAQQWAQSLAASDNRNLSGDANMFQPSGTTGGASIVAYYSRNDAQAAMDGGWGTNANNKSIIDTASWNTIGTGLAVAKSGAVYIVADLVHVNPPAVVAAPLPAPVVAVPAVPAVVQPAPVEASPVEQAPVAEPAPVAPVAPATEATKPALAPVPTETAKPSATPTATPSKTPSESESASASDPAMNIDAKRTSDSTAPAIGKETQQGIAFGFTGFMFVGGGSMLFRNRKEKKPAA